MKYSYYPGCTLHASTKEYDMSTRAVCEKLGIELVELEDWNCCGALGAFSYNYFLSVALPARNLALAERKNLKLAAPCNACFHNLAKANKLIKDSEDLKKRVNDVMDIPYNGTAEVRHLLDIIVNEVGLETVAKSITRPLKGLRVVPYYGCLIVRPTEIARFDDQENPQSLDNLLKTLGAEVLPFPMKVKCCGASLVVNDEELAFQLTKRILETAKDVGANCVAVTCPLCHTNLDAYQSKIESKYNVTLGLPVLYFTQIMGLAMGIEPKKLGLEKNMVPTDKIVESVTGVKKVPQLVKMKAGGK
ncbi:MAG: CoB--CoM heterodisulfide reductase iron-sulfur subunit B family protein [Candidatus Methanoperedens sp.]|nr:CoB--CoM heterodisulfide reductase iron-sulfur subunit B family protein [Candidatus Methanoperedens sp.]MCZ7360858.1 CoB--CoM heterodisulfide reductase iron-sulfur subunit B family protein [Candidatus Methanoperedens sp.]HLB70485.1 CoB--CoM heterodisulfide reductase iron-sulfur subunit B family protein [Candidatus Methanoperedens sp.]